MAKLCSTLYGTSIRPGCESIKMLEVKANDCNIFGMRRKDSYDVMLSVFAVITDALAVFAGFFMATVIRFESGWFIVTRGRPDGLYKMYLSGAAVVALVYLFVFKTQGLFVRPQTGSFINKIPRIAKAAGISTLITVVLAFLVKNEADFSRLVIGLSFATVLFVVLLERYILFRIEWNMARHSTAVRKVMVFGTDSVATHVARTIEREPMLRTKVAGFVRTGNAKDDPSIKEEQILGVSDNCADLISKYKVDQVILAGSSIGQQKILELVSVCEKNLIDFNMVPDLFRILTSSMDVQSLDDIPLLGVQRWPLDYFWNRALKRAEDIFGSICAILLSWPVVLLAVLLVKRDSKGPAFYSQQRCGENGSPFTIYKIRTMREHAEEESGPVWAKEGDPRCTSIGKILRKYNIDELPQLWNVLKGEMSLVGPRPERPHFVERFKEDMGRYMWRHVSKPGMTGWAQVNGLRGNTDIEERLKYDLYYLENWSLTFDFKILLRTIIATKNAY